MTGLVAKLIARNLLERRAHERHPNLLELHLTENGGTLLQLADPLIAGLEEQAVSTTLGTKKSDTLKAQPRAAPNRHGRQRNPM